MYFPYRLFAYVLWLPALCFYVIPECANEWVSAPISVPFLGLF